MIIVVFFSKISHWLLGNDSWALDLANSGFHNIIASGENINLLIFDSQNYSATPDASRIGKKNIGLYAMNYGNAYVASVAVYSTYTQAYQALVEADAFNGPAVVLAYAPAVKEEGLSLAYSALKETKISVDNGTWPLYRWNPRAAKEEEKFFLDSETLKKDLEEFLQKENQLAMFVNQLPPETGSLEKKLESRHTQIHSKILESYAKLSAGLNGPELLILFGSDGGNAEGVARRVFDEVSSLGARAKCMAMNDFDIGELPKERNVIFVVSTAGQGEFPANSKEFWKQLCNTDFTLEDTSFTVFSMGDRNYWPRPEEAIYFCKAGRDLDAKLGTIGGNRIVECGIGDDQDADGFETGLQVWLPKVLKALQLGSGESASKKQVPGDEDIKKNSNYLRGTIAKGLEDTSTGALCYEDSKLTKFHGIYMQDDRDLREERRKQGVERAFIFMVRIRVPGGICTPKQWLALDTITDKYCNSTIKITTRQAIQYHGILKRNLKKSIYEVNQALMDTIAACGDVNRNVMCNPNPYQSRVHEIVYEFSKRLSEHLTPHTSAYHEIWLDKKPVAGNAVKDFEPLYGEVYLPRKFKVAIAIPPHNDVDVYCHDLGYIAIADEKSGEFLGFNVLIGGGMGMTHNNTKTYPCLGQLLAFCTLDQAIEVGEKVMLVQKEHGNRSNRKHARLKYTLEDNGMDWYRTQVEVKLGYKLQNAVDFPQFTTNGDTYDWVQGVDGKWHLTLFVEHGRVKDTHEYQLRTGLRELALIHKGDFRFTGNQNFVIGGVTTEDKAQIEDILKKYKIDNERWSTLRLNSVACTALPTCGLAFAESERYLPRLVTLLEGTMEECGLKDDAIHMRMSGCPNGCSRPYVGEIAMVGRAPGIYNLYLGAGFSGERLNKLYKESLNEEDLLKELKPLIRRYAKERDENEHFGDFVVRAGIIKATTAGQNFHLK